VLRFSTLCEEERVIRPFIVLCLVFAGTWSLAGRGWALLAAGFLVAVLWRREPDWAVLAARVKMVVAGLAGRVKAAPRRATAIGGMTGGIVLLPLGLGVSSGPGIAVAAAGALLIGLSLLAGQGA